MFDPFIVGFDGLFEIIGAIFVFEVCDYGDLLVSFHLGRHFVTIYYNLRMEDLLADTLVKVVGTVADNFDERIKADPALAHLIKE